MVDRPARQGDRLACRVETPVSQLAPNLAPTWCKPVQMVAIIGNSPIENVEKLTSIRLVVSCCSDKRKGRLSSSDKRPVQVGATGFEPATSWSRTKRSIQAELRPGSLRRHCNARQNHARNPSRGSEALAATSAAKPLSVSQNRLSGSWNVSQNLKSFSNPLTFAPLPQRGEGKT